MKKIILFLFAIATSYVTSAQIINFPDANFKARLLNANTSNGIATNLSNSYFKIDANNDSEIQYSEALAVKNLNLSFSNINSLEGIQNFINLTGLECSNNSISTLPISSLINLGYINCSSNPITSLIEIENLVNLQSLSIGNPITSINLSNLSNLTQLFCYNTLLTELNLCGTSVIQLFCGSNPNLQFINVKNNVITPMQYGRMATNTKIEAENETRMFETNAEVLVMRIPPPLPYFLFENCPQLSTICCDLNETNAVNEQLFFLPQTVTVTSTCGTCPTTSIVNLKLNVQGYYNPLTGKMRSVNYNQINSNDLSKVDTISIELRDSNGSFVASTSSNLNTNGNAIALFSNLLPGLYYIGVKSSNSVRTWSATMQTVGTIPLTYDFTTSASKALGNNLVQLSNGVFGIYSGDINNDGNVDNSDYSNWEIDANNFAFGIYPTDLNGDGNVDNSDFSIWETNSNNFIYSVTPFP